ncbi:MAG: Trm112 family protein [Chloroflexi bacterium]|nr:Trm112 family protein [Chloroflexota bacterium]
MVSETLKEILRCPHCVRTTGGELTLHRNAWFVCGDCGRKYPIVDDIPVMLIDEGEKWMNTPAADLPVPPPAK